MDDDKRWTARDGRWQLEDAAMDGSRWTAQEKWLGDGAMDGLAMLRWTARNGQLGAMDSSAMDGLEMDGYGSVIKHWTAR
jgi:hypothetical protein